MTESEFPTEFPAMSFTDSATESPAVSLTKKLVRFESTDPGSYETVISDFIYHWLSELPGMIPGKTLHREEVLPGRFNLMAELPGSDPEAPALVFICHMDTVVIGDGWTLPPFDALEQNGRIYGRGACDMKSGLACCLSAFASATFASASPASAAFPSASHDSAAPHTAQHVSLSQPSPALTPAAPRTLKLICTVDEEDFMRGSEAAIRSGWVKASDWILDAEPTNGQIQVAHKGRIWFEIEVSGHTAHASTPWKGADAIAAMAEIISFIRKEIAAAPSHPDLGISTVTFGQITGGYRPYVVPDSCKVWIDMRLVPPTDSKKAVSIVEQAIAFAQNQKTCHWHVLGIPDKEIPGITASYVITGNRPYIEKDDHSPLLAALRRTCRVCTGQEPVVSCFPGYTDTAVIAGILGNHNCMSYGPGNLECAHQPDEWVEIADIIRCEEVYRNLALSARSSDSV